MILTDEAAFLVLAIVGGCVLVLLAVAVFGVVLVTRRRSDADGRGGQIVGGVLILAVLGVTFGPNLYDRARVWAQAPSFVARTNIPDTLDLTGQRVLFIETDSTICGAFCGDVVQIGTQVEAYWVGAGGDSPGTFTDNVIADILDGPQHVTRVQLAAAGPDDDIWDQRFAQAVSGGHTPPYDVVIVVDDSGLLANAAPELIGGPVPEHINVQVATLVFTDWPDPFSAPPPAPTYRIVEGHVDVRQVLFWPLSRDAHYMPPLDEVRDGWYGAICPFAGPPEDRDTFTYAYRCDPESLNGMLD